MGWQAVVRHERGLVLYPSLWHAVLAGGIPGNIFPNAYRDSLAQCFVPMIVTAHHQLLRVGSFASHVLRLSERKSRVNPNLPLLLSLQMVGVVFPSTFHAYPRALGMVCLLLSLFGPHEVSTKSLYDLSHP